MRFSANLGFLWRELPLPAAIRAAADAGFDAVECHWPYGAPTDDVTAALAESDLPMLSLNTSLGNVAAGDHGLAALPSREIEARAAIDQALAYAHSINAESVHVLAGRTDDGAAHATFIANLSYATTVAADRSITVLIEPLNAHDAPGYFLNSVAQACAIIDEVSAPNLKLMFDCYHVGRTERDVIKTLHEALPVIGHIQFAAVPDRGVPDHGDVDYRDVFAELDTLGWDRPLGAEYRPSGATEDSLGWMKGLR